MWFLWIEYEVTRDLTCNFMTDAAQPLPAQCCHLWHPL